MVIFLASLPSFLWVWVCLLFFSSFLLFPWRKGESTIILKLFLINKKISLNLNVFWPIIKCVKLSFILLWVFILLPLRYVSSGIDLSESKHIYCFGPRFNSRLQKFILVHLDIFYFFLFFCVCFNAHERLYLDELVPFVFYVLGVCIMVNYLEYFFSEKIGMTICVWSDMTRQEIIAHEHNAERNNRTRTQRNMKSCNFYETRAQLIETRHDKHNCNF